MSTPSQEYGAQLAAERPPLTSEQVEAAARLLVSASSEAATAA